MLPYVGGCSHAGLPEGHQNLLKSFSFTNEEEIALASTALDKGSYSQLKKMSEDNPGALKTLNNIQSYFGEINFPKESESSYTGAGKPAQDYSVVKPEDLAKHISANIENRWEWNPYLAGWFRYWADKIDKQEILQLFEEIIEKFSAKAVWGEVLDIIYPIAYEFDSGKAFDMICEAQIKDHGWQRYWTDKKKAESRWKFVKLQFPKRYLEFFQKSTESYVPLSRGVEFLLQFDDLARAEEITEASVRFAESLMDKLNLPSPEWIGEENEITELDILFQRLLWPSPLIRERAATSLANMLCSSTGKVDIFKKLLFWIQQQKMETTVAIGLLPIIKAFYIADNPEDLGFIEIKDICSAILVNSEVIEELLGEISVLTGAAKPELPPFNDIELVPTAYSRSVFFSKHVQTFLPPIYMIWAGKIERGTLKRFIDQWAFTADDIMADSGVSTDSNQVYYYARHEHDEFMTGFSSKISEAYRSAFLRVLQCYYEEGRIPQDFYLEYAYATLPIELSRWKILPARSPEWWPKLTQGKDVNIENKDSIVPISFQNPVEDIIQQHDGTQLIAAEGAIQPTEGWIQADPLHSFLLISFGYKTLGPDLPTAEEILNEISYAPGLVRISSKTNKPFSFLEDKANHLPLVENAIQIKDIIIYPIVTRERDEVIGLWQYFRDYYTPFNFNISLTQGMQIKISKNCWELQNEDVQPTASHTDWLEGLRERYKRDMPLPHGQYLMAKRDFMDKWLEENGFRLGYVFKTTYRSSQYSYDEVKKYEETKLINVSNIII